MEVRLLQQIIAIVSFYAGSVGLHSASSSVNFDNIISGPYRFSEFEKEIIPLDEDDTIEKVKKQEKIKQAYLFSSMLKHMNGVLRNIKCFYRKPICTHMKE
jgi:hypothetical protein